MMFSSYRSTAKKILTLSFIFSLFIYFWSGIINAQTFPSEWNTQQSTNASRFQEINIPILSNVWVALATNIWTDFANKKNLKSVQSWNGQRIVLDEILDINDMISNPDLVRRNMIQANMLTIQEYLAYLRNDIQEDIINSSNKSIFIDDYVRQLEVRFKTSANNIATLESQRAYLEWVMRESDEKIEEIKLKLNTDFKAFDDNQVMVDVENYLEQSRIKRTAYTYLVFCNKFIQQYSFLNNYNKELLDVLILNKKAITTESYVVIPDSGEKILQDFNLLYNESVFKELEQE